MLRWDDRRVSRARSAGDDRRAHEKAVRLPVSEIVSELRDMLGATLAAYLGGVKETRAVAQWVAGDRAPSNATETRLRTAYQATALLREHDGPGVVQAWFQGMNPQLGDVAPARALREQPLDEAGPAVIAAARAFVQTRCGPTFLLLRINLVSSRRHAPMPLLVGHESLPH